MADIKKFEGALDQMIHLMMDMQESLSEESPQETPQETPPQVEAQSAPIVKEDMDSFEELKTALMSDKWPEAVNPNLICDPESKQDKVERSRGIIELLIEEDLKGLNFLDVGCGEGHCAYLSTEYGTQKSVGFDIKEYPSWQEFDPKDNFHATTNFEEVKSHGPFDVITLFDVVDHVKGMDAASLLQACKSVLKKDGKIYLRCHPFISRHATHLYHDMNKAYIHLVFTPDELKQLVPNSKYEEESTGVVYPIKTYVDYTKAAGLNVINRRDITENVEPFFKIPKIAERIMKNTNMNSFPEFQMSIQFIDFVLGN